MRKNRFLSVITAFATAMSILPTAMFGGTVLAADTQTATEQDVTAVSETTEETEEVEVIYEFEDSWCGLKYTITSDGVLTVSDNPEIENTNDTYLWVSVNSSYMMPEVTVFNQQIYLEGYDEIVTTIKFTDDVNYIPDYIFAQSFCGYEDYDIKGYSQGLNKFPNLETVILSNTSQLGNDCFYGLEIENFIVPAQYSKKIYYGVLYYFDINNLYIYNPECNIADSETTFKAVDTIYGYENSTAYDYAEKYGRTFYAFDSDEPLLTAPAVTTAITTETTATTTNTTTATTVSETTTKEVEVLFEKEDPVCGLKYTVTSDGVLTVDRTSDGYYDTYLECLELIVNENLGIKEYQLTNNQTDLEEYDDLVTTIKFTDNVQKIPDFIFATSLVEITPPGERLEVDGKNTFPNLDTVILSNTSQLGNYCFYGLEIENLIIPSEYKELYSIDMNYNNIYIYNSECKINDSEYSISQTAAIYGYENSTAYDYAEKYGRTFYAFDNDEPLLTAPAVTTAITTETTATTTNTTTATTVSETTTEEVEVIYECEDEGFTYTITSDGVMTVSGEGAMDSCYSVNIEGEGYEAVSYSYLMQPYFYEYSEQVKTIKFEDGITRIADYLFATNYENAGWNLFFCTPMNKFPNLETIILSNTSKVGENSFYGLEIDNLIIPSEYKEFSGFDMNYNNIYIYNPECEIYDYESSTIKSAAIHGYENSTAYDYAKKYGRTFYAFDSDEPLLTAPAVTNVAATTNTTTTTTTTTLVITSPTISITPAISVPGYKINLVELNMTAKNTTVDKSEGIAYVLLTCPKNVSGRFTVNAPEGFTLVQATNGNDIEYEIDGNYIYEANTSMVYLKFEFNKTLSDGDYRITAEFNGNDHNASTSYSYNVYTGVARGTVTLQSDKITTTAETSNSVVISTVVSKITTTPCGNGDGIVTSAPPKSTETTTTVSTSISLQTSVTITVPMYYAEPGGYFTLDNLPDKLSYIIGEELDLSGLEMSIIFYPGGLTANPNYHYTAVESVNPLDYPDLFVVDISAFDNTTSGEYTITITPTEECKKRYWIYSDKETFTVTVAEPAVTTTNTTAPIETTVSTTVTTTTTPTTSFPEGDANNDNILDVRDCAYIASMLASNKSNALPKSADFNGDGKVNVRDASAIAKWLAENK